MNDNIKVLLLWVARWFVGLLFIFSGLIKVNDIVGFGYKLQEYFHVFEGHFGLPSEFLVSISMPLAGLIAVFEVVIAFALILGFLPRATSAVLLLMIIFFTFLTGYSAITESVKDCGCFGEAIPLTPWQSFYKDLILLIFIGYIFIFFRKTRPLLPEVGNAMAMVGLSGLTLGLAIYTYFFLPVVDFRPAGIGKNMAEAALNAGNDKLAGYYSPLCEAEGARGEEFKGKTVMFVMKDLNKVAPEQYQYLDALAKTLKQQGVKVYGLTGAGSKTLAQYQKQFDFPYCLSQQDETMVKTLIRSNPGVISLQDGIVTGKWPGVKLPAPDEVTATFR